MPKRRKREREREREKLGARYHDTIQHSYLFETNNKFRFI